MLLAAGFSTAPDHPAAFSTLLRARRWPGIEVTHDRVQFLVLGVAQIAGGGRVQQVGVAAALNAAPQAVQRVIELARQRIVVKQAGFGHHPHQRLALFAVAPAFQQLGGGGVRVTLKVVDGAGENAQAGQRGGGQGVHVLRALGQGGLFE